MNIKPEASTAAVAPLHVGVRAQHVHVHVWRGAEHVVRLVLPAHGIEQPTDEVRPLVLLGVVTIGSPVALPAPITQTR